MTRRCTKSRLYKYTSLIGTGKYAYIRVIYRFGCEQFSLSGLAFNIIINVDDFKMTPLNILEDVLLISNERLLVYLRHVEKVCLITLFTASTMMQFLHL